VKTEKILTHPPSFSEQNYGGQEGAKNAKGRKGRFFMDENEISKLIIGGAIEVHRILGGPGLLEDIYEEALCHELTRRGLVVTRQDSVPIIYKGIKLNKPLFLDVLVSNKVIVEAKAAEKHNPLFNAQLLTYLRLTGKRLGLVINFGEIFLRNGIHRVVNGL